MSDDIHEWADSELSKELLILRSRGEGQELEYKSEFPKNVQDLAKEIAAFATSNAGIILLGVADNGDLVGLSEAQSPSGRDSLLKRLAGICRGTVKPSITPDAKFAIEDHQVTLVISVPKGPQPVYYCHHVPYIRHLTESCPAEPSEVIALVQAWLQVVPSKQDDPVSQFMARLAAIIIDVIIYGEETKERLVNPWLDLWRAQFGQFASELRDLASSDEAQTQSVGSDLFQLANALDGVANFQLYLGMGQELTNRANEVLNGAKRIKTGYIDLHPRSENMLNQMMNSIHASIRKMSDVIMRMHALAEEGLIERVQADASKLGLDILRATYYLLSRLDDGIAKSLQNCGKKLHLVETMELYIDGGRSMNRILSTITEQYDQLRLIRLKIELLGAHRAE